MSERVIYTEGLYKTYKQGKIEVEALKNVNFSVDAHEFVAIMGASGSGKSTLMNILGCLDKPTKGVYTLSGVDISTAKDSMLAGIRNKKIGFVFQAYNLLPKLNALENVELPMRYLGIKHSERRKRAINALELVGLSERIKHKPNEMSGGQKQRVAIARALVNEPSIILADEPTGNLDSKSGEEIMAIFQRINDSGSTIIVVTHEPEIAQHTKRVIVFKDGSIVSDLPVKDRLIACATHSTT